MMNAKVNFIFFLVLSLCLTMANGSLAAEPGNDQPRTFRFGAETSLGLKGNSPVFGGLGGAVSLDAGLGEGALRLGAEIGVSRWGSTDAILGISTNQTVFSIAGTLTYRIELGSKVTPYLGVAIGADFSTTTVNDGIIASSVPQTSSKSTDLHLVFKPGIEFGPHRLFFAETPVGSMSGGFMLMGAFGVHL